MAEMEQKPVEQSVEDAVNVENINPNDLQDPQKVLAAATMPPEMRKNRLEGKTGDTSDKDIA